MLTVAIGEKVQSFNAVELLGMLQQALPGVQRPDGSGVRDSPWQPKTPAGWWYCAKEKPVRMGIVVEDKETKVKKTVWAFNQTQRFWSDETNLAWLRVGGKLISIKLDSFYASQHKEPVRGSDRSVVPETQYADLAYSDMYERVLESGGGRINDANVAKQIRALLQGGTGGADVLPLLTAVLFTSEVARNHTAFHTNLMLLDLVEKGISVTGGTGFKYTLRNTLWQPQIIDAVLELHKLEQRQALLNQQGRELDGLMDLYNRRVWLERGAFQRAKNSRFEYDQIDRNLKATKRSMGTEKGKIGVAKRGTDELNNPSLPKGGGETALPGGTAAMSHKGSAWGSAFDLENVGEYKGVSGTGNFPKPGNAMTIVRRKEATLLIRWLETALNRAGGMKAVALSDDRDLQTAGTYDKLANTFGTGDAATIKILELMQKRVDSFEAML